MKRVSPHALVLGVATTLVMAGCAPRMSVPHRPAPQVVAVAGEQQIPVTDTPPPLHTSPEPRVVQVITGVASYYSNALEGRRTASGEPYDPESLVAAHRDLPFGTLLRVINPANDRSVEVRVIDRGPFTEGRVIDVSRSAAQALDMIRQGVIDVRIEVLSSGN